MKLAEFNYFVRFFYISGGENEVLVVLVFGLNEQS
jgi:hypothetical protein